MEDTENEKTGQLVSDSLPESSISNDPADAMADSSAQDDVEMKNTNSVPGSETIILDDDVDIDFGMERMAVGKPSEELANKIGTTVDVATEQLIIDASKEIDNANVDELNDSVHINENSLEVSDCRDFPIGSPTNEKQQTEKDENKTGEIEHADAEAAQTEEAATEKSSEDITKEVATEKCSTNITEQDDDDNENKTDKEENQENVTHKTDDEDSNTINETTGTIKDQNVSDLNQLNAASQNVDKELIDSTSPKAKEKTDSFDEVKQLDAASVSDELVVSCSDGLLKMDSSMAAIDEGSKDGNTDDNTEIKDNDEDNNVKQSEELNTDIQKMDTDDVQLIADISDEDCPNKTNDQDSKTDLEKMETDDDCKILSETEQETKIDSKQLEKEDDVKKDSNIPFQNEQELNTDLKQEEIKSTTDSEEMQDEDKNFTAGLEKVELQKTESHDTLDIAETNEEYFYNKECVNCNCKKEHKQFLVAIVAALNFFRVPRKNRRQYVCSGCHDEMLEMYEGYAGLLAAKQPLLLYNYSLEQAEFVALDSSDEEDMEKEPENPEFSKNDLKLIENNLSAIIKKVFEEKGIENQLAWSKTIMQAKTERMERECQAVDADLSRLQNISDKMHFALYNSCQVVHQHMPPLDLYQQPGSDFVQVPPSGEIERPPIELNETYYAVKNKAIASWVPVKVIEHVESSSVGGSSVRNYKIKYLNTQYQMVKTVTGKHMAYFDPPPVRLTIGTRVIAFFSGSTMTRGKEKFAGQNAFYPGIIAEPLKQTNRFRYLIFYDDGYTQYVQHKDVRLVCQASERVWEDIHPGSREFIQKYVEKFSVDRPMVQCTKGQSMNTESNGTWHYARVIDIDCSLVLMQFEGDKNNTEWIYRGSLRLGPVFKETQNNLNSASTMQHPTRMPRRTEPFIRYTKEMEVSNRQVSQRAIARKSSSRPPTPATSTSTPTPQSTSATSRNTVRHLNNSTIYVDHDSRSKGHVVFFTAKRNLPPKPYKNHACSPSCLFKIAHRLDSYSPLAKPLLSGWERLIMRQKIKRCIVYRAPCGKNLRNMAEVHRYLRETDNVLNVDNFDFTPDLHCLAEYSIDPSIVKEADISKGQEKMAIPLVNYYDNTLPPPCVYAKQRIPTEGVNLNLNTEFLVGCDCEDDCSDKSKCSCWKLTTEGVRYCNPNKPLDEIGYQYKRLNEHVPTGIYECNSRCKCKQNCLNRVVQHSLEMKLQVFKTSNRGWGLRCVNDIPKGAFICIYAGHLLTETMANEGGLDAGDEYFADLDYIEVAEQLKEGFESDVERSDNDEEEDNYTPDPEDDDDFTPKKHYMPRLKNKTRAVRSNSTQNVGESQERTVINFNPNADLNETVRENSVRNLFGKDEAPYIMDAKTTGNLGRYFNHSCSPNLFVQNVFVDTHDLRFPWVAFFSASHIRSGSELTWNYMYEVGVVPGKVLYCQCGSANCRIRLL